MFKPVVVLIIIGSGLIGAYVLSASSERLYDSAAWMRISMPPKGTYTYKLIVGLWRLIGVAGLLFSIFVFYMVFLG
jgi:hypothetical protein